ncbi:hypothetical protein LPTSP4_34910 [Leptospira ryugenii]|uniref:Uncharacterized protein n=1 Tax=Leptospira ryugenii TaxID=1917863 RepID=A0A2P2E504_9LEPT|nr:hypothetical protein [Leptospira ryugenii]GBF51953.1 hypothetical protein LPTSP4_34910 [Leptospira ryugenii]
MFSPQSSVTISLVSGLGLLAVVSIAPVRNPESKWQEIQSEPLRFSPQKKADHPSFGNGDNALTETGRELDPNEFDLNTSVAEGLRNERQDWNSANFSFESDLKVQSVRQSSDWDLYQNQIGEKKIYFQQDGIVLRALGQQSSLYQSSLRRENLPWDRLSQRRFESFEFQYPITQTLGAVIQSGSYDFTDDRNRYQRNIAMAGISIKGGDFFQAKVLTGDSNVTTTSMYSAYNNNPLSQVRPSEFLRKESDVRQLYEWQANFTPSDYFKIQTSVFNQRTESTNNLSSPDGGKVSLFFGGRQVQMNVKYNYLSSRLPNSGLSQSGSFNPNQDLASLGVIVYLDQAQRYSFYLGNNFYNIFNDPLNQVRDANGRSPSTFSASIRGKNPNSSRSSFFLNFQNQFYKDGMIIGVPGVMPLGGAQQGRSFYEYATSLGVDVTF